MGGRVQAAERPAVPAPRAATDADWPAAVQRALADEAQPRVVFQPLVDISRGVVAGYETLSRFDDEVAAPPDAWFSAALELGRGAELEARVLERALGRRTDLAPGQLLTVNITPSLLGTRRMRQVLDATRSLTGVVLELTEHVPFGDLQSLDRQLAPWREAGVAVALDDAGSGYAGLQQLAVLRPQFVKLDRALVEGIDRDPAKLALAELLGAFAGRLDAWLLAEGIERIEELDVVAGLGVPLAQGFLLGRPESVPAPLSSELAAHLARHPATRAGVAGVSGTVGPLLETAATAPTTADAVQRARQGAGTVLVLGPCEEPLELVRADGPGAPSPVTLAVLATEPVDDVAARAMTRPADVRFDPVVVVDDEGRAVGIVPVERMVLALAGARRRRTS